MSIPAVHWAFNLPLADLPNPTCRSVLIALAWRSDLYGRSFPAIKWISQRTGFSERAIRNALREIEAAGLLTTGHRANASSIYQLACPIDEPGERERPPAFPAPPPAPRAARPAPRAADKNNIPEGIEEESGGAIGRAARPLDGGGAADRTAAARFRESLTDTMLRTAELHFHLSTEDLDHETTKFVAHHTARGTTFVDWHAAWHEWLARGLPQRRRNQQADGARSVPARPRRSAADAARAGEYLARQAKRGRPLD